MESNTTKKDDGKRFQADLGKRYHHARDTSQQNTADYTDDAGNLPRKQHRP